MRTKSSFWNLDIIDALPNDAEELHSLLVSDIYQNGTKYLITGGKEGLYWYDVQKQLKGTIAATGFFHVGIAAADMDQDGVMEIYTSRQDMETGDFKIVAYLPGKTIFEPFEEVVIDGLCMGNPHDIVFADIDGDQEQEMIAVAAYTDTPGLFLYKFETFPAAKRYQIMQGHLTEGIKVADLDGDGFLEIISGPDYYHRPGAGCYQGLWERKIYAKGFRDMCRVEVADITGNQVPDIIAVESEYRDGQFSWFENRLQEKEHCFIEHRIADCMVFAHSLQAFTDESGYVKVMLAEMCEGGWDQPYNYDARTMIYTAEDRGKTWRCEMINYGQGSHQGVMHDIDGDGMLELVTKTWKNPMVQILKKTNSENGLLAFGHEFIDRDKKEETFAVFGAALSPEAEESVVCGKYWYSMEGDKNMIPGVSQALCALDMDGDGMEEVLAVSPKGHLLMMKMIEKNTWSSCKVGEIEDKVPYAIACTARWGDDNRCAFVLSYEAKEGIKYVPEIFVNTDKEIWSKKLVGDISCESQVQFADLNADGKLEIITANYWYENTGKDTFIPHQYAETEEMKAIALADLNGDGELEIITGSASSGKKFGRLSWYQRQENCQDMWEERVIDTIRSPCSIHIADLNGDGKKELVVGEHDEVQPYRTRCRLYVYSNVDGNGMKWNRICLDDRFEHYRGAKVCTTKTGEPVILSQGKLEKQFVHIWKKGKPEKHE